MANEMDQLIIEINKLAKKAKTEGLTEEETARRAVLRKRYIEIFRAGFQNELENIKVVDPNGNDVTPRRKKRIS